MRTTILLVSIGIYLSFGFISLPPINAQQNDTSISIPVDTLTSTAVESHLTGYVILKKDTLFSVQVTLGPYNPVERAHMLNERLKEIASGSKIQTDSFATTGTEKYYILSYLNKPLYYISDADAQAASDEINKEELAEEYLDILKTAFNNLIEQR